MNKEELTEKYNDKLLQLSDMEESISKIREDIESLKNQIYNISKVPDLSSYVGKYYKRFISYNEGAEYYKIISVDISDDTSKENVYVVKYLIFIDSNNSDSFEMSIGDDYEIYALWSLKDFEQLESISKDEFLFKARENFNRILNEYVNNDNSTYPTDKISNCICNCKKCNARCLYRLEPYDESIDNVIYNV